ncbi:hypothetical protein M3Y97_01095800 [Aphelenchoides bicaudatus]|nr:hypothetical protein M3Y97_01095800 [Aphelenchoides bicaudatus]
MKIVAFKPPTDLNDSYYQSGSSNVKESAKKMTTIAMFVAGILIISNLFLRPSNLGIVLPLVYIIFGVMLHIGDKNLRHEMYLPSIIYWSLAIIAFALITVAEFVVIILVAFMDKETYTAFLHDHHIQKQDVAPIPQAMFVAVFFVITLLNFVAFILSIFMLKKVARACQYVYYFVKNEENTERKVQPIEIV